MIESSFFVIVIAFLLLFLLCSCWRGREDEASASEELPDLRRRRQEQRRQNQADQAQASQDPAEDRRRREEVVKSSLFSRKLGEGESINSLSSMLSAASGRYKDENERSSKRGNFLSLSWRSASSSVRSHHGSSKPECSICLDKYEAGETVSWAKNDKCDHLFHEDCIVEWLRGHDDCPLCRSKLVGEEGQEQEDDPEAEIEEGL